MSHLVETAFFVSEPAWHNQGVVIKEAPTIAEGIKAAGLDWNVVAQPIYRHNEEGAYTAISSHKLIVRDTDNSVLGVVGKNYQPLQNLEAFTFFDFLLHEGDAALEAAGSLKNGKRIWVLAKLNVSPREVKDGDAVCPYLLLTNSHDQSISVTILFTPIRVVCWNTLSAALATQAESIQTNTAIRLKHTANLLERLQVAKTSIDLANRCFEVSFEHYRLMAGRDLNQAKLKEYLENVFQKDADKFRDYNKVVELVENGIGNKGQNMWDAYNGVTEYLDYIYGAEGNRLFNSWFGSSRPIRERAHALALSI